MSTAKPKANTKQNEQAALMTAENKRKELLKHYRNEKLVPMYLSPMYRPYFGNVMRVMINGISIFFKVDGSTQQVPQTFADEIARRRMAVDNLLSKQNKMADVSYNVEMTPGGLQLF